MGVDLHNTYNMILIKMMIMMLMMMIMMMKMMKIIIAVTQSIYKLGPPDFACVKHENVCQSLLGT